MTFISGEKHKKPLKNIVIYKVKVKDLIGKDLDTEHIYNDKYLKTNIKSYKYEIKICFYAN